MEEEDTERNEKKKNEKKNSINKRAMQFHHSANHPFKVSPCSIDLDRSTFSLGADFLKWLTTVIVSE